ncbi:MAG: O-antigen ligase family protein [Caldilineaceae bacterium]|nr:O-antigen ligase family protein [Caldilineaceae bacterium]
MFADQTNWASVAYQLHRTELYRRLWLVGLLGAALVTALAMVRIGPTPLPIGGIFFLATLGLIFYQPRWGLYFILFFSLIGDSVLINWYPFVKNLSSRESLAYVHDALIFSPLELYLVIVLVAWLANALVRRRLSFHFSPLVWPTALFTLFLVTGILWGLGTGGNVNIALWESRAIFYLPLMLVLTNQLIDEPRQVSHLIWVIMGAIFVKGVVGVIVFLVRYRASLAGVEAITEHSAAIHMNALFIFVLASWFFGASAPKRFLTLLMVPAVAITYIATQRRAAFAAMGIMLGLMGLMFYKRHKYLFWALVPPLAILGLLYLAVFWNSNSVLAIGAQTVKSIIAPDEGSRDESSNLYRDLENINVGYTIHLSPLLGVGFGQKFHIIVPMPDISFFVWWEYIVHNSVFWIWMKSGLFGFMTMLFLMGFSLMRGGNLVWRVHDPDLQTVVFTMTAYLFMHYMYAYVDMSWDIQSMLYVGTALGLIECSARMKGPKPNFSLH